MNFMDRLRFLMGTKDSQARIALSYNQVGVPQSTPRNYEGFAREGYSKNAVVYRCISMIARSCAGIQWEAYSKQMGRKKPTELPENHPINLLLSRPNPLQGQASFVEAVMSFYLISGNSFIEAVRPSQKAPPMELWPTRPDRMKIVPGSKGYPKAFVFDANGRKAIWELDPVTMQSDMQQMKTFNPLNDWWGMSPLEAALYAMDASNAGQRWNLALLQNSATPSGILKVLSTQHNPGGVLSEDNFKKLKQEISENYSGARNAGRPLLLEGGLDWTQVSMSPKDMEFLKSKEVTAADICQVYGVPAEMLGFGQKTYANYEEARMSFYEETVLPWMDNLKTEWNNWLAPMFGDKICLEYDKDDIEALAPKREKKFTSIANSNFLTQNEKREAVGYEPKEGWDVFIIGNEIYEEPPSEPEDDATTPGSQEGQPTIGMDGRPGEPKPNANGNPPDGNDESDDADESSDEESADSRKGFKTFNLLNRVEKQSSWKRQNARKRRLEGPFRRDLLEDFRDMAKDMRKDLESSADPRVIEFALLRTVSTHSDSIEKTLKRHIKHSVNEFGQEVFAQAKSTFNLAETKATRQWDDWAKRYIESRTAKSIGEIDGTTKKMVQRTVKKLVERAVIEGESNADIADELADSIEGLGKSRAMTIARTEVGAASNSASLNAVKSLQIPGMKKEWVSSDDDRVRNEPDHADHEAMDGVQVELDEKFTVPPDCDMEGPCDPSGPPEQVINCRCVLVYKAGEAEL